VILVTGVSGQLGTAFRDKLGTSAEYLDRSMIDLSERGRAAAAIRAREPSLVINCAAYTAVDRAEDEEGLATVVNGSAVMEMARDVGSRFVTFSTDYVFDGTKPTPYLESDTPEPINAYGRSKLVGERSALEALDEALVIRTSWVMSGTHRNFAAVMLDLIAKGAVSVVADQRGRPTMVSDLVVGTLDAVDAGASGILHLTNEGSTTWYDLARTVAEMSGLDPDRVAPCSTAEYPTPARRPKNSVLDSERLSALGISPLPDYHNALEEAVHALLAS